MPMVILALFLLLILSAGFVALDVYLFWEWYLYHDTINDDYAVRCLVGAIALLLYSLSGRKIIAWLLSSTKRKDEDPKIIYSSRSESLVRHDGSVIHVQYEGRSDGPTILFIHGWNATSAEWYYQRKYLAATNRLVLIDLPGLGRSTRPKNNDFSLMKMAQDVEAVIIQGKLKDVVLYGHSIGGMIILTYYTKVAQSLSNIKGLILEHTTYTNPVKTALFNKFLMAIEKPILVPLCYIMIGLSPIFWLSKWMSYLNGNLLISTRFLTFTGTQTPMQLDFVSRLSAMAPPAVFARGMLAMFKFDVTHKLKKVSVPTLIISGNKDRLTLPDASDYLKSHIRDAQIREAAPAGHQGLIERNEEVNRDVEAFLKTLHNAD